MRHRTITCTIVAIALCLHGLFAQDVYRNPKTDVQLLQKFEDAKLGMFVHWMVCYTPETGDSWSIGDPTPKRVADSISFAWNPTHFDAPTIVATAKRLGCKYMVVIAKHHDGFAIWPTKFSNFNVTRTAFGKDILKELGQECKRQGLLFGIYYSIADIDYCGWTKMAEARAVITTPVKGEADFVQFNKNQVKELITNYDPDILWFDGFWLDPTVWNPHIGKDLYDYIKSLKWNILSTRLSVTYDPGNPKQQGFVNDGSAGDFFAVEAKAHTAPNYPWEGCTSVSYPVYAYDPQAKLQTAGELINTFDKTICGNGNFLLNIGPDRNGDLPASLVNRFDDLTTWITPNAKAVYDTKGGPFIQDRWGGSTYGGRSIYLHIRVVDTTITLDLSGYRVKFIQDLQTRQKIAFDRLKNGLYTIHIPTYSNDRMIPVLEMVLDKPYVFTEWVPLAVPTPAGAAAGSATGGTAAPSDTAEIRAMISRLLPGQSAFFELGVLPVAGAKDSFSIQSHGNKILIEGTNASSMAKGLNYYLQHFCHSSVSWYAADPVLLPPQLPAVPVPVGEACRFENRFFLNYCTFGYTTLWWTWKDWERCIDWMALNGINMPLAITGQEYIWQQVWKQFGMTEEQSRAFFTGPGHLPWQRMGNLDRWLGPLPQHYIDGQFALQREILARERALGMKPILPAFAGHVPKDLKTKFPNIKLTDLGSYDTGPENDAYFLDPMDPLFVKIQEAYLKEQQKLLGTNHYYGADPFNEMDPPSWEPDYLAGVAKTIYNGMKLVDPEAVWVQMGWTFYYDRKHWTNPRLESMIKAVPPGRMLLLDYFCEKAEVWRLTDGFFNAPYIWCYLGNFGGNTQLAAPLLKVAELLPAAEQDPNRRQMTGIGTTLEGFGVNEWMFEWLFDYAWNADARHTDEWIKAYADRRSGHPDPVLESAWARLLPVVYNNQVSGVGLGNIIQSEPMLKGHGHYDALSNYDYKALANILPTFLLADSISKANPGYQRDLAVLEKQVLVNLASSFRDSIAKAYYTRDEPAFDKYTALFTALCDDVDTLLSTQQELLLGNWLQQARDFGATEGEKNFYEKDARVLITTWGGEGNVNSDYAAKDWAGLTSSFYKQRWVMFFDMLRKTITTGTEPDMGAFDKERAAFDWQWTNKTQNEQHFPAEPQGHTLSICEDLYKKWVLFL